MLFRSPIAVIFSITIRGISMSETTLAEGKIFYLIQFSNRGKITKLEGISHKLYKIFLTKPKARSNLMRRSQDRKYELNSIP